MAPIDTIIQNTLQVLSSSAWTGIGVIISSILAVIALYKSGKPHTNPQPPLQKRDEFSNVQQHNILTTPLHANEQDFKKIQNMPKKLQTITDSHAHQQYFKKNLGRLENQCVVPNTIKDSLLNPQQLQTHPALPNLALKKYSFLRTLFLFID